MKAVWSIRKDGKFSVGNDYASLQWLDDSQSKPSKSEFNEAVIKVQAEYDAQAYARNRQYPPLGDQLDDLYHAGVFSAEMTAKLKKVKDDNPK